MRRQNHFENLVQIGTITLTMAAVVAAASATGAQQRSGTCFYGPIRPACSGFVVFEASAIASSGSVTRDIRTEVPVQGGTPLVLVTHVQDLPSYFSGSLGYLRVVGERAAIGGVAELGFSNTSALGVAHRVALTLRHRRTIGTFATDVGVGPLGVEVFAPASKPTCCTDRVIAYGATAEAGLMYRGLIGITAGADVVHGAGRTSFAVHGGARSGSYGTVVVAIISAAATALLYAALSGGID